jgi:dipeptide/tripeptide permease
LQLIQGGILAMPQFLEYFDYPSNFRQGGITASILAGAFAGSILTGAFVADTLGRKRTILLGSALFTIGCAISCAANGLAALVAGRLINGMGNGCLAMMVSRLYMKSSQRSCMLMAIRCLSIKAKSPRGSKLVHISLIVFLGGADANLSSGSAAESSPFSSALSTLEFSSHSGSNMEQVI